MNRIKPSIQDYQAYTAEDFAVWHTLFNRQMALLAPAASRLYLEALQRIGFEAGHIPDFEKVNPLMRAATGWALQVVPDLVPQRAFFQALAGRRFTATCWLRTMAELDYIEEPDMFHDVFGHAPLLVNTDYAAFLEGFSSIALRWLHDSRAVELLGRVYWFTIEFGLILEAGQTKVFGAGIMSSPGETRNSLAPGAIHRPFGLEDMLQTDYRTDVLQEQYFVLQSFEQLRHSLGGLEAALQRQLQEELQT
jgi:phenylalanine-4-hydroxylase